MSIIGLAGLAGAGKSVAARTIENEHNGEVVKFAGALKAMLRAFYAYLEVDQETIERKLEGDLKEVPCSHLAWNTPRYAMQTLGTEWGREQISNKLWIYVAMEKADRAIERGKVAVFDDMRFPNECQAIKDEGGLTIRLVAPKNRRDAGTTHASEAQVSSLPVDYEVRNDDTIRTLEQRVSMVVNAVQAGNVGGGSFGFRYGGEKG